MFYNVENYKFLNLFIENVDVIKNEIDFAIKNNQAFYNAFLKNTDFDNYTNHWVKDNGFHITQIGYDLREKEGSYNSFAIFKKGFPIKNFNVYELFPSLMNMLKVVPNLHYAAFFRTSPLSTISSHTHTRKHLVFHLLLNDLENGVCKFICGNSEQNIAKKGDTVLFDYSVNHGTINEATNERINFVIDFNPFSDE